MKMAKAWLRNAIPPASKIRLFSLIVTMFTGREKFDFRPAFLGHRQVNPRRGDVGKVTGMVQRQVVSHLLFEFLEFLTVAAGNPAGGIDVVTALARVSSLLSPVFQISPPNCSGARS